jgi:hypothetical protein
VNAATLKPIFQAQIKADRMLMTDDATYYWSIGRQFKYCFPFSTESVSTFAAERTPTRLRAISASLSAGWHRHG